MMCQSAAFTDAARIRNKTWRSPGLGVGNLTLMQDLWRPIALKHDRLHESHLRRHRS
jgi:hypothetical protein